MARSAPALIAAEMVSLTVADMGKIVGSVDMVDLGENAESGCHLLVVDLRLVNLRASCQEADDVVGVCFALLGLLVISGPCRSSDLKNPGTAQVLDWLD